MRMFGFMVAAMVLSTGASVAGDAIEGRWKRPNGDVVVAAVVDGRLNCTIESGSQPGFEMCHGMEKQGDIWRGSDMKHPEKMRMLSFNGTAMAFGEELKIKGCAVGDAFCDAETWLRSE
ncbi:MAG: DUF2147 domain-containing protein [Notoacmeibacter sp.]|nr:DUF2147 domain-containing protein [Notoacmeibacter sp.]MCC0033265.1 DUF2147 domain-containing protein [Brucellaceae bacterium]